MKRGLYMDNFNFILESIKDSDYASFDLDPICDGGTLYITPSIRYKVDTEGTSDDAATIILTNTIHSKDDTKNINKLLNEIRITINRDTLKYTTRGVYVLTDGLVFDLHDILLYPVGWTDPMKGLVNQILCTLKLRVYYSKMKKVIYKKER